MEMSALCRASPTPGDVSASRLSPPPPAPDLHLPQNSSSASSNKALASNFPTLESVCLQTDYVPTCRTSLSYVTNGKNSTYQDFIVAAINEAIQDVNFVKDLSKQLLSDSNIGIDHQALNDCDELLSLGLYDLKAAVSAASNNSDLLDTNSADIKNWLSAVLAYQEACSDGLMNKDSKLAMNNALKNPKQKTSNALAILDSYLKIQTPPENNNTSRILLSDDYPSWFSFANRRLLEGNESSTLQPDAIVAGDGSGQFRTIGEALNSYKLNGNGLYVIYVKAGVYNEHVFVPLNLTNVYMYGDGIDKTIVSDSKHATDGFPAYRTATIAVLGDGFVCKSMTIQNRAKSDRETVALRIQSDKAAIFRCKIEGSERSLYALAQRQFYRECIIIGSKDIIFGDSATIIQKSQILVRKSSKLNNFYTVTAQGRTERTETTGFVLHDCNITQETESWNIPTYLGRPAGRYSRTLIMQSYIGNVIDPEGWSLGSSKREKKMCFAELENNGPGADTRKRIKSEGYEIITNNSEAENYFPSNFIQANLWLGQIQVPFEDNLL
ncbi:pectinesterase-like isoform X2 [Mercurialis annua]|uniref:pectinesterase-like isoform X2 n=1 Tax=Mercurialis annua TaxID=3986 RepID=UPI00215EB793|nr:pectinesterase-like isoform X2 [Mercurialis annua]